MFHFAGVVFHGNGRLPERGAGFFVPLNKRHLGSSDCRFLFVEDRNDECIEDTPSNCTTIPPGVDKTC